MGIKALALALESGLAWWGASHFYTSKLILLLVWFYKAFSFPDLVCLQPYHWVAYIKVNWFISKVLRSFKCDREQLDTQEGKLRLFAGKPSTHTDHFFRKQSFTFKDGKGYLNILRSNQFHIVIQRGIGLDHITNKNWRKLSIRETVK